MTGMTWSCLSKPMADTDILVRYMGRSDYVETWAAMKDFTDRRNQDSLDELWVTEHAAVFTQGLNGKPEHLLNPGDIPVVQIDRGGQVTFHGPGQLMIYPLLDLRRAGLGVRPLVTALEQSVVDFVAEFDVAAVSRADAPGVYVGEMKLASVGLRIRRGSSLHGMALNVDIDLEPFSRINPCGYEELQMTDLNRLGIDLKLEDVSRKLLPHLLQHLGILEAPAPVTER